MVSGIKQNKQLTTEELLKDRGATFEDCFARHQALTGLIIKQLRGAIEVMNADPQDIQQECYIGLYDAFTKYDPSRGVKFSSYAIMFMRGRSLRFLRDRQSLIHKPRTVYALEKFCRENDIKHFEDLQPHYPRLLELGMSPKMVKKNYVDMLVYRDILFVDAVITTSEGTLTIADKVGYQDQNLITIDFEQLLAGLKLSKDELTLLNLRLEGYSQKEMGIILGISQVQAGRRLKTLQCKISKNHIID